MLHIVRRPRNLRFQPCVHKPTEQEFAILPEDGSVETSHGTMTFRRGDPLLVGVDGKTLYTLSKEAFAAAYSPKRLKKRRS